MSGNVNARLDQLLEADPTAYGPELATRLLDTVDSYEDLRALAAPLVQELATDRIKRHATRLSSAERRRREDALAQATLECLEPAESATAKRPAVVIVGKGQASPASEASEMPRGT